MYNMKKLIFISAVSGVGKSTACEYIKKSNLLEDYAIFDIDDLENINNYNQNTYNLFYENAIKKAIILSNDKNIVIGSCINPNDIEKIKMPNEIESYINILITCSNEELRNRLKARDKSRQCSSDEYIKGQIDYQNYLLKNIGLYQMHVDNTEDIVENVSRKIINFIKQGSNNMENYIFRKYENADYEFVYEVKKNSYKKYVEQCWGKWDDIDQKNRFKESMEKTFDRIYIIMLNNERIGFYQGQLVNERTYYIENICIIPEYQGQGIGTKILNSILEEYSDKNIEIQFFKQNPVGKLYKKLGFVSNGETEFHYQMIKWKR